MSSQGLKLTKHAIIIETFLQNSYVFCTEWTAFPGKCCLISAFLYFFCASINFSVKYLIFFCITVIIFCHKNGLTLKSNEYIKMTINEYSKIKTN